MATQALRFHRPYRRYVRPRRLLSRSSTLDEAQHRCATLVLTWIMLTDAAEGALATEESAHPSLGQVHPEVQAAYLPLGSSGSAHRVPLNDRCTKCDGPSQLMTAPCSELLANPQAGTLRRTWSMCTISYRASKVPQTPIPQSSSPSRPFITYRPPFLAAPRLTTPFE